MERRRLFWLECLKFFLPAKLTCDFTEGRLRGFAVRIERRGSVLRRRRHAIIFGGAFIFARLNFGLIFRREDLLTLEVFFGIDVLGALLLFLFAGAFLPRRIGNALILLPGVALLFLRARNRSAQDQASEKQ